MALVSYVDILEVVGEINDFKTKLVEGEEIAQRSGISELSVNENRKDVYTISAKVAGQKQSSFSVTINIERSPRFLDCKCSCLEGRSGKCQHVVATLIHIHRNNITSRTHKEFESQSQAERSTDLHSCSPQRIEESEKEQDGCRTSCCDSIEAKLLENINAEEPPSNIRKMMVTPAHDSNTSVGVELEAEMCSGTTVSTISKTAKSHDSDGLEFEISGTSKLSNVEPRMGRGCRKTIPNPRYMSDSKIFACALCLKSFGKKVHYEEHLQSHTSQSTEAGGQGVSPKPPFQEKGKAKDSRAKAKVQSGIPRHCEDQIQPTDPSISLLDFKCADCDKSFPLKKELDAHLQVHAQGKLILKEKKSEHEDLALFCDVCGKRFTTLLYLTRHKSIHNNEKPFQCKECGKNFSRERTFKAHKHQEKKSSNPIRKVRSVIKCETCGKEFTNRMHHVEHMRSHTGERPFQCVECGKCFASKRSLRNHTHSGKNSRNRPHTCGLCPASFATAFMLKTHERSHTDEKPFICEECGKSYRSQHVYQDHLNHHKGIRAHICKECGKSFTWRTSLWAHMRDHAKVKPFECVQCGAMFAEQSELKDHWEVHLDDKPHQCPECGLGFMHEADCQKHVEIHKKLPSHACKRCDLKFTLTDELQRHMQTHIEKKKCLCPSCGQIFSSKGHLKVHMLIHSGVKPFECETCQKRFYTRSLLRKHTVFHSNERPFECALCGDKFPTQGILRAHIRTHTGERPYSCKECGKSFPQSAYLKRHVLTHTGEKPYPCSDCDSAFVSRYDLKIHMRTHTGEKPFACEECSEKFCERAQLTVHQRTHTGEKAFKCDICNKGFNSSNHIKKHFGRVHPNTAPFCCLDCGERFMMCEALRKHRKGCQSVSAAEQLIHLNDNESKEMTIERNAPESHNKDPLNRLIQDSEILVEESCNPSCDTLDETNAKIITHQYEIVHVDLVDSSQLIKLEVYHAGSLVGFDGSTEFQAVSINPIEEPEDAPPSPESPQCEELPTSSL